MADSATERKKTRPGASFARRYGMAFASVAAALLLDLLFHHFNLPHPFAAFALSAIAITFWYGGTKPGIVAVLLSSLIRSFIFESETGTLSRVLYQLVFLTFALLMIWVRRRKEALEVAIVDRTAELTAANEDLRRRKEQLDGLFELSPDAVILTDEDFHVLRVNQEFTRIFGYIAEEVAGQWLPDLIVPEELRDESLKYRALLTSGKRVEMEVIRHRKGGVRFDVSVVAKKFSLGIDRIAVYLIYREITERKNAERQLRRSEGYLAEAQRLSHTGSFGWSIPTGELFWSEETFQIFQYEQTTKPTVELFLQRVCPEDAALVKQTIDRASQDGKDFEHEYRLLMPDGSLKYVHALVHASWDKSGGIEFVGAVSDVTRRKRAEEALLKSEERWRSVFENSAVGVALTDMDGRFLATNHVYQTMLGYTEEELRTLQFLDITHEDYRKANWALIAELVEGKRRQFQIEKKYKRKDGTSIWVRNNVSLVPGTERVPRFIMALSEDITQRKRAEEALRRSEAYLAEGQRLAKTGSWAVDPKTEKCIYWSEEMRQIFGLDPRRSNLPDREEFLRLVHPEDRDRFSEQVDEALRAKADLVQDYRIVLPDGTVKHIHGIGHLALDETGNIIECVGTDMDVTERKRAEQQLRRSEADLLEAQRISQTGSWKHDVLSGTVIVSPEVFRIFGVKPDEDTSTTEFWLGRNHPDDQKRVRELFERAEIEKTDYAADYRIILPDGAIKHLHAVGHPIVNESGEFVEFIGTVMDITERKKTESELRRSEGYLAEAQKLTHTGSWAVQVPQMENVYWSKEMYQIFGLHPDCKPPSYMEVARRLHPEDSPHHMHVIERAIRDRTDFETDYRLLLSNGADKYIHVVGHPVVSASGDVIEFVGTAMDITERKQAEDKIREKEVELRQILDAAPQHLSVLSGDGSHLYINQSSLDFLGLTLDEWQKRDIRELVHPDDAERVDRERKQALSSGSQLEFEARFLRYDGQYRWLFLHYKPLKDQLGCITRWVVPAIDIDDRKRSEERLHHENVALREEIDRASMFEEIVGSSAALQAVLSHIVKVAPTDSTVLITGETGTGKELIARAIHKHSQRSGQAFISVNCASIPSSLIASELFGHEKGAFTGAVQRRQGRFELAHSGTIFLDEVGELPADTQIALLRVLQERQFERVGGNRIIPTDVRVIAATNRDLTAAIAGGTFRSDLFYRLNVFPIEVPPLRKRKEDIPMLVEYFVKRYAEKTGKRIRKIDTNTLELCQSYSWPGNIRELQNIVERSVILSSGDTFWIEKTWLANLEPARQELPNPLPDALQSQEREIIETALAECKGKVAGPKGAAAKLGIPRSTLDSKIKQLKIKKHKFISDD
ncbi:PAS domain S-box protein [Tunturiibacter lichenicola]|uniref:PAS domain S-box protein n=1 Tax=Tunturiibacter lichenicola TaxID=2051959 RepID=UPI0021B3C50B|nr:PAS domain S-box protein [Edaphobacter lichenicola]